MDTPTFEELCAIQEHIKDAMAVNTLITVKDDDVVEQPIDDDLHRKLREAWKHVYLVMDRQYPEKMPHKVKRA